MSDGPAGGKGGRDRTRITRGEVPDIPVLLAFFDYGEADRQILRELKPVLEKHAAPLVEAFYNHLRAFPQTEQHLRDPAVVERLLGKQREYLVSLAGPEIDEDYVVERQRIGRTHEMAGIEASWYLGAYSHYLGFLVPLVCEHFQPDIDRAERAVCALHKVLLFDAHVAMTQYQESNAEQLSALNLDLAAAGRRLAIDLERTGAELRRTSERAKAAERLASIGTLVAGLAHEIGTPMGVIQGHAKLLERRLVAIDPEDAGDARWRLETIQEQIGRISRIMQSLLNMARPSRSRRMPVDLGALLESTLAFLEEKLAKHGIAVDCQEDDCPGVIGDPERLQQLLLNLFLNAVDAMPEGGTLRVRLRQHADDVEITIADTGVGIPTPEVATIFDPFFTTKPAGEGNGLGLSVAHGIATEHGGDLTVASTGPDGTVFSVVLPLTEDPEADPDDDGDVAEA